MLKFTLGLAIAVSAFSVSANIENETQTENVSKETLSPKKIGSQTLYNRYNVAAQKLAGEYPIERKSYDLEKHSRLMRYSWNKLYSDSLSHIPAWTEKYLNKYSKESDTLFYPFGGPDVSYALSFFPNVKRYILVGLEPLGNFNQVEKRLSDPEFYQSVQTAFASFFRMGYFITSEMISQLSNKSIRGGLNLILPSLQKLGFTVVSVRNCAISPNGEIIDPVRGTIDCVKIVCEKNSQTKEIYYVRANLDNRNDKLESLFKLVRQSKFSTLIKSSSYALHNKNFSKIRGFILNETDCILQDDTGIPFNFFRLHWDIHIFGTYTKPTLKVFQSYKQNSLNEYYSTHKAEPIPFLIGYGYRKRTPNLILAVSKPSRMQEQMKQIRYILKKKKCDCNKTDTED